MGCDIHVYLEHKNNEGQWEELALYKKNIWYCSEDPDEREYDPFDPYRGRSYSLFSALAGVRNGGHNVKQLDEPRGLPQGISQLVSEEYKRWEGDAHSASHATLIELRDFSKEVEAEGVEYTGTISPEDAKKLDDEGIEPLKWCSWTSDKNWVQRTWHSNSNPVKHFIEQLETYIKLCSYRYSYPITDEDARNIRVVFWFDN